MIDLQGHNHEITDIAGLLQSVDFFNQNYLELSKLKGIGPDVDLLNSNLPGYVTWLKIFINSLLDLPYTEGVDFTQILETLNQLDAEPEFKIIGDKMRDNYKTWK